MRSLPALLAVSAMLLLAGAAVADEDLGALNTRVVELYQQGDYAAAAKVAEQAVKAAERQFGNDAVVT